MTSADTTPAASTPRAAPVTPTPAPVAPAAKRRHSTGVVIGAGLVGGVFGALFTAGASVLVMAFGFGPHPPPPHFGPPASQFGFPPPPGPGGPPGPMAGPQGGG